MAKFAVLTSNSSISNSNSYSNIKYNNRGRIMDTLLSTTSFFEDIIAKISNMFSIKRSISRADRTAHLCSNSSAAKLWKLNFRKASSCSAKTIEEFDLAEWFDRSEIIAIKREKIRALRSYCNNLHEGKWQYDPEREQKENCRSKNNLQYERQINQKRGN